MRHYLVVIVFAVCAISCGKANKESVPHYFDIAGYFKQEQWRLNRENPAILKTVSAEGKEQTKTIGNIQWKKELELFRESDINKPGWKDRYTIVEKDSTISYYANDDKLPTRRVVVSFNSQKKPVRIQIEHKISNGLYNSSDTLEYVKDQYYSIHKSQDVRVIGKQDYKVRGIFPKS